MQCASSIATSAGFFFASISPKPGTLNRSGATKRNCSRPVRYSTQAARDAARSSPLCTRATLSPSEASLATWSSISAISGEITSAVPPSAIDGSW